MPHRLLRFLSATSPREPIELKLLGLLALIAFFAGGIRSLNDRKPELTGWTFAAYFATASLTSALAGFIVGALCLHFTTPLYLTLALVSVAGWLGVVMLDELGQAALKRLRRRIAAEDTPSK